MVKNDGYAARENKMRTVYAVVKITPTEVLKDSIWCTRVLAEAQVHRLNKFNDAIRAFEGDVQGIHDWHVEEWQVYCDSEGV